MPLPRPRWPRPRRAAGAAVLGLVLSVGPGTVAQAQEPPTDPAATTVAPVPATPPAGDPAATTIAPPVVTEPETERIDDPDARHAINRLIALLIGLAVVVLALTAWFWRATRPLAPALEPLAVMSTRRFRRKSPDDRSAQLASVHALKAAHDPPPRAADLLRQVQAASDGE